MLAERGGSVKDSHRGVRGYIQHIVKRHRSQTTLNRDEFPGCNPGLCPPMLPKMAPGEEATVLSGGKESSARVPASLRPLPSALPFTSPDVTSTTLPREQGVAETSNPMRVISLFVTFDTDASLMV